MQHLLETERLILRRFSESDGQHLYDLDNDPDVMRYINGGTPTSMQLVVDELLPSFLRYDDRFPVFGFWAALEKITGDFAGGDFVGWFSLRADADDSRVAILGYRLHKLVWGKGLATEGARALIDMGFAETEIEQVAATTYEENVASQRVMEKVGMSLVRRFRLTTDDLTSSDTHHVSSLELWDGDDLEYALTRADWAGR